ncbi:MAG: DoxX family protein [Sphingomonas adhaesiva]|uniref:DoxX family protein n=1 Tax=Sphingomonas adhaesiva TaxID=28212 RepID=UPI002FF869F8
MADTRAGRVARGLLAAFYAIAGIGHLVFVDAVVRIVPPFVPAPRMVVLVTGLCELVGALGLMLPRWRRAAGWALAAYALCVWPANLQHAVMDLSRGTGLPIWYHAPRLLLQPVIVWWALWASGIVAPRRSSPRP